MSPKVSDEYLEARRAQILDAARCCFVRGGYHRTTMAEICKEAKLSPGAVYRYFEGKEAIFEGLAERRLQAHTEAMQSLTGIDNLFESTARMASEMMILAEKYGAPSPGVMDLELAGESVSNPRIAAVVLKMIQGVRNNLSQLVERLKESGKLDPAYDSQAVASVMMALFQGALFQSAIGLDFDHAAYLKVVQSLKLLAPSEQAVQLPQGPELSTNPCAGALNTPASRILLDKKKP